MTINDNVIREIFKAQGKRRWNIRKCWPVKFVRNIFGFTAIEELEIQLITINLNLQSLHKQVNDLAERMDAAEEYNERAAQWRDMEKRKLQESVDMWFDLYKTAQNRVENLEKRIAELQAQPKEEQKDDLFACPAE